MMKENMKQKKPKAAMKWLSMDLHIHTRASSDYQQPEVTYLDILKRAEVRNLDIIAFSDHNTIAGYRQMRDEIQQLELLKKLKRILPEEQARLDEYNRLLNKILVLPAFEFTATFGFHIIGVFPPEKPLREIEHILLDLKVPPDQLDAGSVTVGAASDVLTVYHKIAEAGGLVIAAHANSSNGVAMRGFNFGGQTKIAFTQDANLHALEVTDLDKKGPGSTAAFFNGTKPEYPRRMHCIQASDCHRLIADTQRKKNLGLGDRATDVFLAEASFPMLLELFQGNDFSRTRPHRPMAETVYDFIRTAREEGPNIIQDFHEGMSVRGGKRYAIITDACAFANTNGGTLYVGLSANPKEPVAGVPDHQSSLSQLEKEIDLRISPPLDCTIDIQETGGKKILRVLVPRGEDAPYAVDDNKIYIRSEAETNLAVRDEIVSLVLRSPRFGGAARVIQQASAPVEQPAVETAPSPYSRSVPPIASVDVHAPRTGVEVVSVEERKGDRIFTLRDLRNGNIVKNVTRASARRLWHYAITNYNAIPTDLSQSDIYWQGDIGLLKQYRQGKDARYDLVHREGNQLHYYFGVTEEGIDGAWLELVGLTGGDEEEGSGG